jgi:hypothetical protein
LEETRKRKRDILNEMATAYLNRTFGSCTPPPAYFNRPVIAHVRFEDSEEEDLIENAEDLKDFIEDENAEDLMILGANDATRNLLMHPNEKQTNIVEPEVIVQSTTLNYNMYELDDLEVQEEEARKAEELRLRRLANTRPIIVLPELGLLESRQLAVEEENDRLREEEAMKRAFPDFEARFYSINTRDYLNKRLKPIWKVHKFKKDYPLITDVRQIYYERITPYAPGRTLEQIAYQSAVNRAKRRRRLELNNDLCDDTNTLYDY